MSRIRASVSSILILSRPLLRGRRWRSGGFFLPAVSLLLSLMFLDACGHLSDPFPKTEVEGAVKIFEADDRIILKAITRVLKDRGWGEPREGVEPGRIETDYVVQGSWRTRVEATVKKISRREREVRLSLITEQKSFFDSQWRPKSLMGKEQYDQLFREIEMQIYREWAKPE